MCTWIETAEMFHSKVVVYEGDDEIETADGTRYTETATAEWSKINMNEDGGRSIDPVECDKL